MRTAVLALIVMASAGAQDIEDKRTIQRSFKAGSPARLEIDNVNGAIHVSGHDSTLIEVTATETVRAESKDLLDQARRDVRLDITDDAKGVRLYVDGPFRCSCGDGSSGWRNRRRPGYSVRYDFEVRLPRGAFVALRTVNHGDIKVENIAGDYDIENINGGIEMLEVEGSGEAYALNHPLKAVFRRNPRSASRFGSLNGQVHLYFQPGLAADFRIKTFNGKVYSDFPMTTLPAAAPVAARTGTKFVYRSDKFTGARVGAGGPEIKLDGFNGDMHILTRQN